MATGNKATKSIFDTDEFQPFEDRWNERVQELSTRKAYYTGEIYTRTMQVIDGMAPWLSRRLYEGIKPLFLPLARAVDVDAGIVPAGWRFPGEPTPAELARDAEMPSEIQAWVEARDRLFKWSKWHVDGVLYVHYGAQYGLTGLKVSDLREENRIEIKPVKPTQFLLVEAGEYDDTPQMAIYIESRRDEDGQPYEYAEVITTQSIRTFRNGEPEGFEGREEEYPNDAGIVPFVERPHIKTGEPLGEATYQKSMTMLDEVNQIISYLADVIGKQVEPQWAISGAEPSDLVKSGDNVWFFTNPDAKLQAVVGDVDINGVMEFIKDAKEDIKDSLPEHSFDELRRKDQIATATMELQLIELVLKVQRMRPNYDDGLVEALQLAGRAAQTMGLSEIAVLDDEDLELDQDREIIPLDPMTRLEIEQTELAVEQQRLSVEQQRALGRRFEGVPGA